MSIVRLDVSLVEHAVRDAKRIVAMMRSDSDRFAIPKTLWKKTDSSGYETPTRIFQRTILDVLSESTTTIHPKFWRSVTDAVLDCVADCDEWLGVQTCHAALVKGCGERRPLGWLISNWMRTRPSYFCKPEDAALVVCDPEQDKYWKEVGSPIMYVQPPRSVICPRRRLVVEAMAVRDDALELLDNHWLHRVPIQEEKSIPRRDPLQRYGHTGIGAAIAKVREKKAMDEVIMAEAFSRMVHDFRK